MRIEYSVQNVRDAMMLKDVLFCFGWLGECLKYVFFGFHFLQHDSHLRDVFYAF